MPDKPTTVPTLDTNSTNRTVPAPSKVTDGYVLNDTLPAANVNYLWGWMGDWLTWLDGTFGDGAAAAGLTIPNGLDSLHVTTGLTRCDAGLAVGNTLAGGAAVNVKRTSSLGSGGEFCVYAVHEINADTGSDPYAYYGLVDVNHTTGTVSSVQGARIDCVKEAAGDITNLYGSRCLFTSSDATDAGAIGNLFGYRTDVTIGANATCTNLYEFFAATATGSGAVTNAFGMYVAPVTIGSTLNVGLYVAGVSGGTNNWAIWTDGGECRFDDSIRVYASGTIGIIGDDQIGNEIYSLSRSANDLRIQGFDGIKLFTLAQSGIPSGTLAATFDASQNTTLAGQCQATTYRATESKVLYVSPLGADHSVTGVQGTRPDQLTIDAAAGKVILGHAGTESQLAKPVHLPHAGTITACRIRLKGTSSHSLAVHLFKKNGTNDIDGGSTTVASVSGTPDVSATAGTWVTLSLSAGAVAATDVVWLRVLNSETATTLFVGPCEITMTMDDVTTCKP